MKNVMFLWGGSGSWNLTLEGRLVAWGHVPYDPNNPALLEAMVRQATRIAAGDPPPHLRVLHGGGLFPAVLPDSVVASLLTRYAERAAQDNVRQTLVQRGEKLEATGRWRRSSSRGVYGYSGPYEYKADVSAEPARVWYVYNPEVVKFMSLDELVQRTMDGYFQEPPSGV